VSRLQNKPQDPSKSNLTEFEEGKINGMDTSLGWKIVVGR
jgi:hypothetical protein